MKNEFSSSEPIVNVEVPNDSAHKFRPLHDRILVQRREALDDCRNGIFIPDSAKEKPQEGEVIAVGKGKPTTEGDVLPLDVKVGDWILFGKYAGTEIKIDSEDFLIMREEEVLGKVKVMVEPASNETQE